MLLDELGNGRVNITCLEGFLGHTKNLRSLPDLWYKNDFLILVPSTFLVALRCPDNNVVGAQWHCTRSTINIHQAQQLQLEDNHFVDC